MTDTIQGQCLCGAVKFEIQQVDHVDVCHCKMCRSWNGGPFVGADIRTGIKFHSDETLSWYESSDWARRGFCNVCGSSLFYTLNDDKFFWSISAGALDLPEGLSISKEIFLDEKPDYYNFAGEQPRLTGPEFLATLQEQNDD
ncbi:MAG: GFA family protein [Pseudomonadota bacterium]